MAKAANAVIFSFIFTPVKNRQGCEDISSQPAKDIAIFEPVPQWRHKKIKIKS
jgi:hypothetical protein